MRPADPMLLHAFDLLNASREQEALAIFRELAARDNPAALATLAELTWTGALVPRDLPTGRILYQRAGDAGHLACAFYATNLLASGNAGHRDWTLALERLHTEARLDAARAEILALLSAMVLTSEGDPCTIPEGARLSDAPGAKLFRGAFTAAECAYLASVVEPDFKRAMIIDEANGGVDKFDPIRTSEESPLHWLIEDPVVHAVNRRLAALSGTSVDQGEPLQILRYRPGQEYRLHVDFLTGEQNQRVLTALLYLNADYDGGETCFPRVGLKVKGGLGDVLVFRNALADERIDPLAAHAGLPVIRGTKYLASRWIRARQYLGEAS